MQSYQDITLQLDHIKTHTVNRNKVHYIPIRTKNNRNLECIFKMQLLAASCKPNFEKFQLSFKRLTENDLKPCKFKDHEKLLEKNGEFIDELEVLHKRYLELVDELLGSEKNIFTSGKNIPAIMNRTINDFKQTTTKDGVVLDNPIYRISLPYDKASKTVSLNYNNQPKQVVNYTVKNGPTTLENAEKKLSYLTCVSGMFVVESLVMSSRGISIKLVCKELMACTHPIIARQILSVDEKVELMHLLEETDDDSD